MSNRYTVHDWLLHVICIIYVIYMYTYICDFYTQLIFLYNLITVIEFFAWFLKSLRDSHIYVLRGLTITKLWSKGGQPCNLGNAVHGICYWSITIEFKY